MKRPFSPQRIPRNTEESAFTLLEVLLAVAILSMLLTVAYGSMSHIIRGKNFLDEQRDAQLIGDAVLMRMTRELQLVEWDKNKKLIKLPGADISSAKGTLLGVKKSIGNNARGDEITFQALEGGQYLPDGGRHTGTVQITYRVERDPEQSDFENQSFYLIRDEVPYTSSSTTFGPDEKKALESLMTFPVTNRLAYLEFSYYSEDTGAWSSEWNSETPPLLIRFRIGIRSRSGKILSYSSAVHVQKET